MPSVWLQRGVSRISFSHAYSHAGSTCLRSMSATMKQKQKAATEQGSRRGFRHSGDLQAPTDERAFASGRDIGHIQSPKPVRIAAVEKAEHAGTGGGGERGPR